MTTNQMLPFFWSWACLLLGVWMELKYRQRIPGLLAVVLIVVLAITFMYSDGSIAYFLGLVGYLVGMLTVLLTQLLGIKFTR